MSTDSKYVVLVTGSRTWPQPEWIYEDLHQLHELFGDLLVVRHGKCRSGADNWAKQFCEAERIEQDQVPADWDKYGRRAGFVRNAEMVDKFPVPNLCLAYIHFNSNGATMCSDIADNAGVYVLRREIND